MTAVWCLRGEARPLHDHPEHDRWSVFEVLVMVADSDEERAWARAEAALAYSKLAMFRVTGRDRFGKQEAKAEGRDRWRAHADLVRRRGVDIHIRPLEISELAPGHGGAASTNLESAFALTNTGFFFREYSFRNTKFTPTAGSELELADHVVLLDQTALIFQLKERADPTEDPDQERKWFESKVVKKGTKQIRDTLRYLREHSVVVRNDRGRAVNLTDRMNGGLSVLSLVVFDPASTLPLERRQEKFHISDTAGFIHLVAADDWLCTLRTLVTPTEVIEYLGARERICRAWQAEAQQVSEVAILGQHLADGGNLPPSRVFEMYAERLVNEVEKFDMTWLLHRFADRIEPLDQRMARPNGPKDGGDYYRILDLLVNLTRAELGVLKERFMLCWDSCGSSNPFITRFATEAGVGFALLAVPMGGADRAATALLSLTHAHKYDLRLDRCIGLSFTRDGTDRLVVWSLVEAPWRPDPGMDRLLEESPLPKVQLQETERYTFRTP